jgi:hypothetical protein
MSKLSLMTLQMFFMTAKYIGQGKQVKETWGSVINYYRKIHLNSQYLTQSHVGNWVPNDDQENQKPDELLSKLRRTTNTSFFQCPTTSPFHAWVNPNFTKLVEIFKGGCSRGIRFKLAKIQSFQWHPWLKGCVSFWNGDYIHIMKIGYNFVVKLVQSSVVWIYF